MFDANFGIQTSAPCLHTSGPDAWYIIFIVGAPEETTNYLKSANTEMTVSLTYVCTMFWTRHIMPVVPCINNSITWMIGGFAALQVAPTKTILMPGPVVAPWVISTCPLTLRAAPLYIIYSPIPPIPRWIQIITIVSSIVVQTTISGFVILKKTEIYKKCV